MREFMTIVEDSQVQHIKSSDEMGEVDGHVVNTTAEDFEQWLSYNHHIENPELAEKLATKFDRTAFLNTIGVDDEYRGQGHGNYLLDFFIHEARDAGAKAVILVADSDGDQQEGFDLIKFYTAWGFKPLLPSEPDLLILDMTQKLVND